MINLPAIFIANGAAILLLLIVLLSIKRPLHSGMFEEKIFYAMILFNIIQCLFESIVFFLDGKALPGYRILSIILNEFLFINTVVFAYLWVIFVDYKLFSDMERIKRIYPFVAIPTVLIIIGCIINPIVPVFFTVNDYNIYQRTNLFIIPYAVTYFYLIYGVVLIYSFRKRIHKYLFLPAVLFMVPIIISSALQFFFYGYSLVWLGVAIGLTSLFINVQNESSYVDMLSGLFNRQYLNNYLLIQSKKVDTDRTLAGILLDIDGFKNLNDSLGHLVGDDAISSAGKILRESVGNKGVSFRLGGDEFIVLMQIRSQKEIFEMIDRIKTETTLFNETKMKPYELHFSIGCSIFDKKNETIDDFLRNIDASMYEDKRKRIFEKLIPDRREIL
ncbi:MAG: GGDEF domain-containing protein [Ruminococcaceae bacterium]|nr:GGDEF domain-containing protein [Oscillospiraceae bacterium]